MPPAETKKTLSSHEIALLKKWIKQGAKWAPYWAYQKPNAPDFPTNLQSAAPTEKINFQLAEKIKEQGLTAAPAPLLEAAAPPPPNKPCGSLEAL